MDPTYNVVKLVDSVRCTFANKPNLPDHIAELYKSVNLAYDRYITMEDGDEKDGIGCGILHKVLEMMNMPVDFSSKITDIACENQTNIMPHILGHIVDTAADILDSEHEMYLEKNRLLMNAAKKSLITYVAMLESEGCDLFGPAMYYIGLIEPIYDITEDTALRRTQLQIIAGSVIHCIRGMIHYNGSKFELTTNMGCFIKKKDSDNTDSGDDA